MTCQSSHIVSQGCHRDCQGSIETVRVPIVIVTVPIETVRVPIVIVTVPIVIVGVPIETTGLLIKTFRVPLMVTMTVKALNFKETVRVSSETVRADGGLGLYTLHILPLGY